MTERLEERLEALRDDAPAGDWLDVVRRTRRRRRTRRVVTVLVAATVAAAGLVPFGIAGRLVELLSVSSSTDEPVPAPVTTKLTYVFGDRVHGPKGESRMATRMIAPLLGSEQYLAVASPDDRSFVYHAWDGPLGRAGAPVLRIHELDTGRDRLLARGAQTVAWRSDGALAYQAALRPVFRPNTRPGEIPGGYIGHVVVRSSPEDAPQRWTTRPTHYNVLAWARQALLVQVRPSSVFMRPQPGDGIYALDGPGKLRLLPIDDLIAVSPDGRRALGWWPRGDQGPAQSKRLVDVASGRVLAELKGPDRGYSPGDWRGETLVGVSMLGMVSRLFVLDIGERLSTRQVLKLDEAAGLDGFYGAAFGMPLLVGENEVVVRVTSVEQDNSSPTRLLTCELVQRKCRSGRSLEPLTRWAAVVTNPSRP